MKLNYYNGTVDAVYGPDTEKALINFATAKDLDIANPEKVFKSLLLAAPLLQNEIPRPFANKQARPMIRLETQSFFLGLRNCLFMDPGSLSAKVVVTLAMEMTRDGKLVPGSLRMIDSEGGSGAALNKAFLVAQGAVLRCAKKWVQVCHRKNMSIGEKSKSDLTHL